jgi:hypothetical protein
VIEAEFEVLYLAHAPMEPLTDVCMLWNRRSRALASVPHETGCIEGV